MKQSPKECAARAALEFVADGMTLGLGTGSTAAYFVKALGEKVKEGWDVKGIPTSEATARLALEAGIELIEPDETTRIDVAVDGADEADGKGRLIKGGGGALLREKIIAAHAEKFVVIADASKDVTTLGKFPLPIEVVPFGWALSIVAIRRVLTEFGYINIPLQLRADLEKGGIQLSDGENYIVDAPLQRIEDPEGLDKALTAIPGVVTTGLFLGLTDVLLFGSDEGVDRRQGF